VRRVTLLAFVVALLGITGPGPARAGCNANQAWQDRFPAWSPTGGAIAFMRQQVGCDPPAESLGILQSGHAEEIIGADGAQGSWASPSWSPNGVAVALGSIRGSVAVDAPGGPVGDDGPGAFPSWAGSSISVTVGSSLQLIELITGARRTLVPSYVKPTQSNGVAAWSPDRSRLALGVMTSFSDGGIAVVNADGSGFRVIARGPNQSVNPSWSPDGQRIAFESNRDGDFEIYSVQADGTDVRDLSRSTLGDDRMPAWHGDTIAFISNRDRSPLDLYGFALYTMSSDGSNQRWRAADLHPYSGLSWSPDGSQIAFASGRECFRWGIYVIDLQTESVRRVTNQCTFTGSARNDILTGTPFMDYLNGGAGNDRLYGLGGEDRLRSDYGNDSLYGGPGADLLLGGGGRNTVRGGDGNDRIQSDPRGHDRIFGGGGNDLIESASGSRDVVSCGPGRDTVVADKVDRVGRDCEHVRRI
jgi:WD40 repeat protein